jgi:hypothetical protein
VGQGAFHFPDEVSVARLRKDPFLPVLLPRIFEVDGLGRLLERPSWRERGATSAAAESAAAMVALAAVRTVARTMLLERTLARLLRGDAPPALRPFVELHQQLSPTLEELAAHQPGYLRLLPDSPSFVAAMAQGALRRLDEAARLPADALAEASRAILGRAEKGLVREQLAWLRAIVKRDSGRLEEVGRLLSPAFAHPDLAIAQYAQSIVDGKPETAPVPASTARPAAFMVPAPAELGPPVSSLGELSSDLIAVLKRSYADAGRAWERVLDGLVRMCARTSPPEVGAALSRVMARIREPDPDPGRYNRHPLAHLRYALIQLAAPAPRLPTPVEVDPGGGLDRILVARINELTILMRRRPVPFLLATPTSVTGHLRADALVDRMAQLESAGLQPWPYDLDQALLRLPREVDIDAVKRSRQLLSPAGRRASRSLARSDVDDPATRRVVVPREYRPSPKSGPAWVALVEIGQSAQDNALVRAACGCQPSTDPYRSYPDHETWPAALPSHQEIVAAHLVPLLADAAQLDVPSCPSLSFLAHGTGPSGPAVSLALAYGLAARSAQARASAIEAASRLSAQGRLNAPALGQTIGSLVVDAGLKLNRLTGALAEVATAGHPAAVWDTAYTALPALLHMPHPPGATGDLLQLAGRVAAQTGARGSIAGLDATATRDGSSRLVTEARRLQRTLADGTP